MRYLQISPLYFLKNTCLKRPTCLFKKANTFHSLLRHCIQNQRGVFLKKQKNKQEKREVQFMRKKEENEISSHAVSRKRLLRMRR